MDDVSERDEPLRAKIAEILRQPGFKRAKFARMADVADATVERYVKGETYSKATEAKLRNALARQLNGAIDVRIPSGNKSNGDLLLEFKKLPLNLTGLRVEVFGHDEIDKLRMAWMDEGAIHAECSMTAKEFDTMMAKFARMRRLLPA